jgi:hypothetical protein
VLWERGEDGGGTMIRKVEFFFFAVAWRSRLKICKNSRILKAKNPLNKEEGANEIVKFLIVRVKSPEFIFISSFRFENVHENIQKFTWNLMQLFGCCHFRSKQIKS